MPDDFITVYAKTGRRQDDFISFKRKKETGLWEDDFTFNVVLPLTTQPLLQ